MRICLLFQAVLGLGFATPPDQESPTAIPEVVTTTLSRSFPGVKPEKIRALEFHGLRLYESTMGESEAIVAADGTLAAILTSAGTLPAPVAGGASGAAHGAKIEDARKVDAHARLTFSLLPRPVEIYSLSISKDGRQGALKVAGDGTVIQPLEWARVRPGKRDPGESRTSAHGEQALPPAAVEALRKAFPEPALNEVESRSVLDAVVYDVEVISRLGERQVHVTHDGILVAIEQDAPAAALPRAVLDAAARAAGGLDACMARKREIRAAASLTRLEAPAVSYRLRAIRPTGRVLIDLGPHGALLRPPLPLPAAAADE